MPRESLDAPEDLPKEAPGQVTFGQLEDEVPSMPDEPPTGLEESLLETRQGPALNGDGQGEPAQEIAEVVGDDPEQEADLVGPEAVTGEARPILDPLLGGPALVVEADDGPVRPRERGNDKAHPWEQFPEVMRDLGDHASRSVPGGGLIREAPIPDQRRVARSAAGAE